MSDVYDLPFFEAGKVYFLYGDTYNALIETLYTNRPRGTPGGGMLVEPDQDGSFLSAEAGAGSDQADDDSFPDFDDGKLYIPKQATIKKIQALIKQHHCVATPDGGIDVNDQGEGGTWLETT